MALGAPTPASSASPFTGHSEHERAHADLVAAAERSADALCLLGVRFAIRRPRRAGGQVGMAARHLVRHVVATGRLDAPRPRRAGTVRSSRKPLFPRLAAQ